MEIVHVGSKIDVTLAVCHEGNVGSPVILPFTMSHLNQAAFDQVCEQVKARRVEMLEQLSQQATTPAASTDADSEGLTAVAAARPRSKKKPSGSRR